MDIESLIERASDALETGNDEDALAIGQQLIDARHTYGFEVLARAWWLRDERTRAIETLQDGVTKAPQAWALWELLGEYWTEVGDEEKARACSDQSIAIARAALASGPDEDTSARLHAAIAHALLSRDDRDGALEAAWAAIRANPSQEDAMWVIREIEQRISETARQFRVIVRGELPDEGPFVASYIVIADGVDEARELVARFEPATDLEFEEAEIVDDAPDLPKGVYWRSSSVFEEPGA
jgi:tetratricopeptide (TPR) repeat protein